MENIKKTEGLKDLIGVYSELDEDGKEGIKQIAVALLNVQTTVKNEKSSIKKVEKSESENDA